MGLNDAREQLEACKAQSVIDERRITDLEQQFADAEQANRVLAESMVWLQEAKQHALVMCRYCGYAADNLGDLLDHVRDPGPSVLAVVHPKQDEEPA